MTEQARPCRPARFRTIVADPPWEYDGFARGATGGGIQNIPLPYPSMSLEDLADLEVRRLADPNGSFLWMWTTNRYLPDAFQLMGIWGFAYRQTLVWRKTGSPPPFGGAVSPNHAEYLLFGRRGQGRLAARLKTNVVDAPAQRVHSAKPEVFIDLIEQTTPGPYLEMFARRARFGWEYWGDQSLGTTEVAS